MRRKILALIVSALALSGCSQEPAIGGFKDVQFGLASTELSKMGFDCTNVPGVCELDESSPSAQAKGYTLFGKSVRVLASVPKGNVDEVTVFVDYSDDELIALFKKALGKPESFTFDSFGGSRVTSYYWASNAGTSVTVSKIVSRGYVKSPRWVEELTASSSTATYRDKQGTLKLVEAAKGRSVDEGDF